MGWNAYSGIDFNMPVLERKRESFSAEKSQGENSEWVPYYRVCETWKILSVILICKFDSVVNICQSFASVSDYFECVDWFLVMVSDR